MSTPISTIPENRKPDNRYHVTEWGFRRFRELVSQFLKIEEVYLQLYSAIPKINTGIFSLILKKTGLTKDISLPETEKLLPHKWLPEELNEDQIGTKWTGYQILQCKKK